jgi:excinuclease ABC subunit A
VIKQADWIIDLGPEGGEAGGRIVAQGTPEQVARNKKSYTGQALARVLDVNGSKPSVPPDTAADSAVPARLNSAAK